MITEIQTNEQFKTFVQQYAERHRNCEPFHDRELHQHLPLMNYTKMQYMLADLCIAGVIKKVGNERYQWIDKRDLKQKVLDCFGNKYTTLDHVQLSNILKQRQDYVEKVVKELVEEGVVTKCPFLGQSYWINETSNN